jgi:ribosomal protein S8
MNNLSRIISSIITNQKTGSNKIEFTFQQINNFKKNKTADSAFIIKFLQILENEGFIRGFFVSNNNFASKVTITIYLKYDFKGNPVIRNIKQISLNSLPKYVSVNSL